MQVHLLYIAMWICYWCLNLSMSKINSLCYFSHLPWLLISCPFFLFCLVFVFLSLFIFLFFGLMLNSPSLLLNRLLSYHTYLNFSSGHSLYSIWNSLVTHVDESDKSWHWRGKQFLILKLSFYTQSKLGPLKQGSNSSEFNIRQILLAGLG